LPAQREGSLVGADSLRFLNETGRLSDHGWDDPGQEKLWRYHLHYFDDLNAEGAASRVDWHRDLLARWVRENPPAAGTGWEPYPASLRIVNWIKWALSGNELPAECVPSLAVQTRWLAQRLETHLLGNHLFANAKALVFAGLFFDGPQAAGWLERGMQILEREVLEQILPDGGQFERSPMYHALALEDMLDLCNVTAVFGPALPARRRSAADGWRTRVGSMRAWLGAMCHPDGEISFFNDAALAVAPTPADLERYARCLGFPPLSSTAERLTLLAPSGYARVEQGAVVALLDLAPVGPDYLPGHAHADTLSFELSWHGQRVIVNSGTSCYAPGAERWRQRGTAAHSTVVVDGQDSSEVWASFRVARRAHPFGLEVADDDDGIIVRCSHDGYARLPGKPVHERRWWFRDTDLVLEDFVRGRHRGAEARFHLHPEVHPDAIDSGAAGRLVLGDGRHLAWQVELGVASLERSSYHPRFGVSVPARCLVIRLQNGRGRIRFTWG
jgi:uncharacterized heparinase superfamily protein